MTDEPISAEACFPPPTDGRPGPGVDRRADIGPHSNASAMERHKLAILKSSGADPFGLDPDRGEAIKGDPSGPTAVPGTDAVS